VAPPMGAFAGPFLMDRNGLASQWAHQSCIMWCPEVYFDANKGRLRHVEAALKRGRSLKCAHCDLKGATVGCTLERQGKGGAAGWAPNLLWDFKFHTHTQVCTTLRPPYHNRLTVTSSPQSPHRRRCSTRECEVGSLGPS